jgi:hypothetical protein
MKLSNAGLVISSLILCFFALAASANQGQGKGRDPKDVRSVIVQWQPGFEPKARGKKLNSKGLYSESLLPSETDAEAVAARISKEPGVQFAEVDYDVMTLLSANDPSQSAQWALTNIKAATAWNYNTGSAAVKVCVM